MTDLLIEPVPISGIDEIDLDSHAVIEASAGTGKTYTIENLIVALLKQGRITSLEEVLVVTYTEKAAGELKDRIRQNIKKEMQEHPSEILQASLDNFDSASIFTIHGFCNAILREYAFENGEQFQNELIDDRVVYQQALCHIKRTIWPARYGDELPKVLRISRYPGSTGSGMSSWENLVMELATRFQPAGNDRLLPERVPDLLTLFHDTESECRLYLDALEHLIGPIDLNDISNSDFPSRYATLNINRNSMGKRLRIIEGIVKLMADRSSRDIDLVEIDDVFSNLELGDEGFHELNTRWKKEGADYNVKLPELPRIIELLEKLRTIDYGIAQNMLASVTVDELKHYAVEYKRTKGLISYDDMVTRVYHALADRQSLFAKVLHQKYRYALVDEFQDTDMIQWKIFSFIFLDSRPSRLFIIGDPKQSIYGFRGADVHAYYTARDEMIHTHRARYYCLDENWRSSPDLITCYNNLFRKEQWFSDSNIHYLPSHYPKEQVPGKHRDTKSLIIMDCGTCSGTEAKYKTARFIAAEVLKIIADNRAMALNDIAVLVTKWKEAEIIEKVFKKNNISYSLYKKEGLYQSLEVLELSFLLTAIAKPGDIMAKRKALMTRFFRVPIQQLHHYSGTLHDHPAHVLFEKWNRLAELKQWPLLIQSIMEDTGILYHSAVEDNDRSIINYRSILQNLEIEAYRNNFSIRDGIDYLNSLRQKISYSNDSYNIQAIDLDKPGVQILTIHASKGLQFKTVFIAGGYTKKNTPEFWIYHSRTGRIFDLVRDPADKNLYNMEIASEDERLFYVALTRAQDRLYIPLFEPGSMSKSSAGIVGEKLSFALSRIRTEKEITWIPIDSIEHSAISMQNNSTAMFDDIILPDPLFPDRTNTYLNRRIYIDSFSGLKTMLYDHSRKDQTAYQYGDAGSNTGDDDALYTLSAPVQPGADAMHDLPRNKETGIMLHAIFEHIDFHKAGDVKSPSDLINPDSEFFAVINNAIQTHINLLPEVDMESIRIQTATILWNTLNAPLDGSDLVLKDLNKKMHEVEFYYPYPPTTSLPVPEMTLKEGYMHGFIDMIFLFNDKYYILDWKSNFLEEGYSPEQLEKNILDMHYDLQIRIYHSAVIRWLKKVIPDYSYDDHFGGIYYLYLRGMDRDNSQSGIYFFRPHNES